MSDKITKEELHNLYISEKFNLEIYKTKGMIDPGIKFKGTASGLFCAYAKLVEAILKEDLVPTNLLEDAYEFIKKETRGKHGSK